VIREKQVPIAEQPPEERIRNFNEVPFGYTEDEAVLEAERCLQCPTAPCVEGCPVGIDIPRFIDHVKNRRFAEAIATIKEANALPAVCGRVCPQESQCQGVCTLGKRFEPVAIGRLERFCADWAAKNGLDADESIPAATGKKVAVIGSGPAGLTAAGELRKMGHAVTVFELLHAPGGVLMYGIPEFRLPKEIVKREIPRGPGGEPERRLLGERVPHPGEPDARLPLPRIRHPDQGWEEGRHRRRGERRHGRLADRPPSRGGGVDHRLPPRGGGTPGPGRGGPPRQTGREEESIIVYRRGEEELPARAEEVHHAKQEGIRFHLLANPVEFIGESGMLKAVRCIKMELGGRPEEAGPDPRLGVRDRGGDGRHRDREPPASVDPPDDRRPRGQPVGEHRRRPRDREDEQAGGLRRRGYRHRRRYGDRSDGSGEAGRCSDRLLPPRGLSSGREGAPCPPSNARLSRTTYGSHVIICGQTASTTRCRGRWRGEPLHRSF